ncbi:MAG: ATPase [Candidatus Solibacter usitatus]|nr:ATPase [Candidatus Solibacter usitatus]
MTFFLGVDGGQSSTTAIIGDETGRALGYGRGGPCNHVEASAGRAKFLAAMKGCLEPACEQAAVSLNQIRFARACLGFSGGPADKEALLQQMLPAEHIHVTNDAVIALSGATAGEPGIITIAGTGSISLGRNARGKTARAGGWGYSFGDEGGGYDLARQALRAALRMEEGWGAPTALHGMLLEASGARNANDLLHQFYTEAFPRPRIASFSRLVDEAAMNGDAIARELLHNAARQLAGYTAAVRGQLFAEAEPAVLAYVGGVFKSRVLLDRFVELVSIEEANRVGPPLHGPAVGALLEAYRYAGLTSIRLSNVPEFEK